MPTFSVKNSKLKGKLRVWASGRSLLPIHLACVASASSKAGAKKEVEGGGGGVPSFPFPSPVLSVFFFLLSSQLSRRTREETLATQAKFTSRIRPDARVSFPLNPVPLHSSLPPPPLPMPTTQATVNKNCGP